MATPKSSFLGKVLDRIGRLDKEGLQSVVERLARERSFLETLFNTIEDGVLVLDESGRIRTYVNVYIGEDDARAKGGTDAPVPEGSEVMVIPAMAGGA